jgi:sigma-E factor negative regulatory protein RseC
MNVPEGKVVLVGRGFATVSVNATAACARCAAGRGCGAGLLQKRRKRLIRVNVAPGLALKVGDPVRLELAPRHLMRAAWLAYGLPLATMLIAVGAASALVDSGNELVAVLFGAGGLFTGTWTGRRILAKDDCLSRIMPTACERIASRTPDDASEPRPMGRAV